MRRKPELVVLGNKNLERETGFEPATSTLARSHSTTELFPLSRLPGAPYVRIIGTVFRRCQARRRGEEARRDGYRGATALAGALPLRKGVEAPAQALCRG